MPMDQRYQLLTTKNGDIVIVDTVENTQAMYSPTDPNFTVGKFVGKVDWSFEDNRDKVVFVSADGNRAVYARRKLMPAGGDKEEVADNVVTTKTLEEEPHWKDTMPEFDSELGITFLLTDVLRNEAGDPVAIEVDPNASELNSHPRRAYLKKQVALCLLSPDWRKRANDSEISDS